MIHISSPQMNESIQKIVSSLNESVPARFLGETIKFASLVISSHSMNPSSAVHTRGANFS